MIVFCQSYLCDSDPPFWLSRLLYSLWVTALLFEISKPSRQFMNPGVPQTSGDPTAIVRIGITNDGYPSVGLLLPAADRASIESLIESVSAHIRTLFEQELETPTATGTTYTFEVQCVRRQEAPYNTQLDIFIRTRYAVPFAETPTDLPPSTRPYYRFGDHPPAAISRLHTTSSELLPLLQRRWCQTESLPHSRRSRGPRSDKQRRPIPWEESIERTRESQSRAAGPKEPKLQPGPVPAPKPEQLRDRMESERKSGRSKRTYALVILALASLAPVHGQYQVYLESKQSAWAMRKPTTIECQLPPEEKPNKTKALFFLPVVTPHPVRAYACSKEVRTVCTEEDTLLLVIPPGRSLRKNPDLGSPVLDHGEGVQSSQRPHAREAERASVWTHRTQGIHVRAPRRGVRGGGELCDGGRRGWRSSRSEHDLGPGRYADCSALAQNCTTGAEVVVWEPVPATSFCSHKRMETLVETLVTSDRIMVDQYSMGFFRSGQETGRLGACVPEGSIRLENDAFIWFIDGEEGGGRKD